MNDDQLNSLFAQARARRPDTSAVEYAFETRLLARLRAGQPASSVWAKVSWRLIPVLALGVAGLFILQTQVDNAANEAAAMSTFDNPGLVDVWNNSL